MSPSPETQDALVEAVARTIYEGRNGRGCKPWSLLPKSHKEPYLKDARVAIDAARPFIENEALERAAKAAEAEISPSDADLDHEEYMYFTGRHDAARDIRSFKHGDSHE